MQGQYMGSEPGQRRHSAFRTMRGGRLCGQGRLGPVVMQLLAEGYQWMARIFGLSLRAVFLDIAVTIGLSQTVCEVYLPSYRPGNGTTLAGGVKKPAAHRSGRGSGDNAVKTTVESRAVCIDWGD